MKVKTTKFEELRKELLKKDFSNFKMENGNICCHLKNNYAICIHLKESVKEIYEGELYISDHFNINKKDDDYYVIKKIIEEQNKTSIKKS